MPFSGGSKGAMVRTRASPFANLFHFQAVIGKKLPNTEL